MTVAVRARATIQKVVDDREPWTGPVVRRSPEEYMRKSEIITWRCPSCRHWTPEGSRAAGKCLLCHTPKPADK